MQWCNSQAAAHNITTQPKQGRQPKSMGSQSLSFIYWISHDRFTEFCASIDIYDGWFEWPT
jgi:hypothetical protein